MTEKHYTEDELAAFARGNVSSDVAAHFGLCEMCKSRYQFLKSFYTEYESKRKESDASANVGRLIALATLPNVIELRPYTAQPNIHSIGADSHTIVLAAQGEVAEAAAVTTEATFASEELRILLRAMRDRTKNYHILHVLSATDELTKHVLLVIKDPAGNLSVVPTNANSIGRFDHPGSVDWKLSAVAIRRPIASFVPSGKIALGATISSDQFSAKFDRPADRVTMTFIRKPTSATRVLFVMSDDKLEVKEIVSGQIDLDDLEIDNVVEIRLFN